MLSGTSRKTSSDSNTKFYSLREEPSSTTLPTDEIEDLKDKIFVHLGSFKINSTPNTDNMGKLFVTLFPEFDS